VTQFAGASTPEHLPSDWRALLKSMITVREFEDNVKKLFTTGEIRGSTHLCQGQEAVSVGVCSALRAGDTMTCSYRGHGAVLAMGAPVSDAFAEILGKESGLCGGKGGSMHLADFSVGALGSNAIVGAQIPIAVGAGLASQYLDTAAIATAFTGDGSTNIGAFHEALNLAAIWKLPVLVVVENNHYGEYSSLAATTPIPDLARRADSYGIPGIRVDGNDVLAVRSVAQDAAHRARAGLGPTLIEADTYRFEGHSRSDPATYRPRGELEEWQAKDPIVRFERVILDWGVENQGSLDDLHQDVKATVLAALEDARSRAAPDALSLNDHVFK